MAHCGRLQLLLALCLVPVAWRAVEVFWSSPSALYTDLVNNWATVHKDMRIFAFAWGAATLYAQNVYYLHTGAHALLLESVSMAGAGAWQLATQPPGQPEPGTSFVTGINATLHAWGVRPFTTSVLERSYDDLLYFSHPDCRYGDDSGIRLVIVVIAGSSSFIGWLIIAWLGMQWCSRYNRP